MDETIEDLFCNSHLELQGWMQNSIAFHDEIMGGVMYLQKALSQPDAKKFVGAIVKKMNGHVDCNNWTL
jgi:hypothetical protein